MKLGTGGGSLCSRYTAYTKCSDVLLVDCPASVGSQVGALMKSATVAYSSQLKDCSSSESTSNSETESEKPNGAASSSGGNTQANSCLSSELSTKSSSCRTNSGQFMLFENFLQKNTAAAAGGNTCGAWQTYECCVKDSSARCGDDVQSKISTMMSTMKTQYDKILT